MLFFCSGELIRNSRFDPSLWADLIPNLIESAADTIVYQRAARNIGLAWHYLVQEARLFRNVLHLQHCEIVYKDFGEITY